MSLGLLCVAYLLLVMGLPIRVVWIPKDVWILKDISLNKTIFSTAGGNNFSVRDVCLFLFSVLVAELG